VALGGLIGWLTGAAFAMLTFGYISLPTNTIPLIIVGTAEWRILAPYWRTFGFDGLGDWLLFNCMAGAAALGLT
jgi:hypothetical protein